MNEGLLVVIIRYGLVDHIHACLDSTMQEYVFKKECNERGYEPIDYDYENGYKKLPEGTSICITSSDKFSY